MVGRIRYLFPELDDQVLYVAATLVEDLAYLIREFKG